MQRFVKLLFSSLRLVPGVLALCALFSLVGSVSAAGTWVYVGSPGFSTFNIHNPALAFDSSGTPYVAFRDAFPGVIGKLTVKKFDGTNWVTVGSAGFSPTQVDTVAIAIDGTVPYVAYRSTSDFHAKVMKFESGSWTDVNSSGLSGGGFVTTISLVLDASTPYLSYVDATYPSTPIVMKLVSGAWTAVGSGIASSYADYPSLAIYNHTPYLAFFDGANSEHLTVKKFESGTWLAVGAEGFSSGVPAFISLAIDGGGTPYVAFADQDNGAKATVMKFDGTNWGLVGSGVVSTGVASLVSLAIDSTGKPQVAFQDGDNGNKATVMKFDGVSWSALGGVGFTANVAQEPSIKIYNDTPYIVFWEQDSTYHGSLMKYDLSPAVTAFAASSISDSFNIPITTFTASGNDPITGYGITESAGPPSAGSPHWSGTAPTTYTVPALGTYTLYPWVKDSANRVSRVYGTPVTVNVTASTIEVGSNADSGPGSLRKAISNVGSSGVITFDDNYTINLDSPLTIDRDVTIDGGTKTIVLDGQDLYRVIEVGPTNNVTLDNLTIQKGNGLSDCCGGGVLNKGNLTVNNGLLNSNRAGWGGAIYNDAGANLTVTGSSFSGNSTTYDGGAIYNAEGHVDITNSTFSANSGDSGGAVANDSVGVMTFTGSTFNLNTATRGGAVFNYDDAKVTVSDTTFSSNSASGNGGAVYNRGTFEPTDTSMTSNIAQQRGGGVFNTSPAAIMTMLTSALNNNAATQDGGAIYNEDSGKLDIDTSTLDGNTADTDGGAIFNDTGATLSISKSTVSNNIADDDGNGTGDGGGIKNKGAARAHALTAMGNQARKGGGIFEGGAGSASSITNSTVSNNTATTRGGGIYTEHTGTLEIVNVTLSGNTAPANEGGGISHSNALDPGSTLSLKNTIIANSPNGSDCRSNGTVTGKNSLVKNTGINACNLTDGSDGNVIGSDPRLAALANNGGPNRTQKLGNDSPAIDAGDQATCDDVSTVNKLDQRSKARDDLQCDIGGFELTTDDSMTVQITPPTGQMRTYGPTRAGIKSDGTQSGVVSITRQTIPPSSNTLPRSLEITAPTNTGLNLTLKMCYSAAELGSLNENNLKLWSRTGTGAWTNEGTPTFSGTSPNRCAERSGITHLSEWTLGSAAPTASDAVSVRGAVNSKGHAVVRWESVNEVQIVGYNIYRKTRSKQGQGGGKAEWKQVNVNLIQAKHLGTVQGANYRFADKKVKAGKTHRYKIQVLYADNHITWTDVVYVKTP